MAQKKTQNKKNIIILVATVSLVAGAILSYYIASQTNLLPINYQKKFNTIYAKTDRERNWETYIDLMRGYQFNYPNHYDIKSFYTPETIDEVSLTLQRRNPGHEIIEFKKQKPFFFHDEFLKIKPDEATPDGLRQIKSTSFNEKEVIIINYEMTQEVWDQYSELPTMKGIAPLGSKKQFVYIKEGDYFYSFESQNLSDETQEEIFTNIWQSFKTFK